MRNKTNFHAQEFSSNVFASQISPNTASAREWTRDWPILADKFQFRRWTQRPGLSRAELKSFAELNVLLTSLGAFLNNFRTILPEFTRISEFARTWAQSGQSWAQVLPETAVK